MDSPIDLELERLRESRAEKHFVGTVLFEAADRLAARRGEELQDINEPGYSINAATGTTDGAIEKHITFEAAFACLDDTNSGFLYELIQSKTINEEFRNISAFNQHKTLELLESDEAECGDEQAQALLKLIEAYADPKNEEVTELEYSSQYRLSCKADQVGENMIIEHSLQTYLDGVLISHTSIGNLDVYDSDDEDSDREEDNNQDGDMELDELDLREIEFSTATLGDIDKLHEMLCMLGLADRKKRRK